MKQIRLLCLLLSASLIVGGCGSSGSGDYDSKNIAVEQPGDGPPPMKAPMGGGESGGGK